MVPKHARYALVAPDLALKSSPEAVSTWVLTGGVSVRLAAGNTFKVLL